MSERYPLLHGRCGDSLGTSTGKLLYDHVNKEIVEGIITACLMKGILPDQQPNDANVQQLVLRRRLAQIYLNHMEREEIQEAGHSEAISYSLVRLVAIISELNGNVLHIEQGFNRDKTDEALKYYREFRQALLWANEHLSKSDILEPAVALLAEELRTRLDDGRINNVKHSIVDVGCGPGRELPLYQRYLGDLGAVSAFDQSPAMVEIARGLNPGINIQVGDLFNPDREAFPSGSAMAVSAIAVLHHFEPDTQLTALKKMRELVTDNGLLFLTMRHGKGLFTDPKTGLSYYRQTFKGLDPMLREAGFRVLPQSKVIKGHNTPVRHIQYLDVLCGALPSKQ